MTTTIPVAKGHDERRERRSKYHEADVVVVGAGVFGCAMAHTLANQGRSVLLLERWMKEPDRIVGELLQPGGVFALRELGLGDCIEGIDGVPCYGYDVVFDGTEVVIPYPHLGSKTKPQYQGPIKAKGAAKADGYGATHDMPRRPEGKSFHHGRFINQLRKACLRHPNITVVETEVVSTIKGEGSREILGVESRTINLETGEKEPDFFFGNLTIVADGYASKFRKEYIGVTPIVRSKFYALELIDCPLPHANYGHVVIGKGSPCLLYQIGSHETRALIDVPNGCPEASPAAGGVRGYIENVVIPSLPPCVQPSFHAALADVKIPRSMPNSWLPPTKQGSTPGLAILGDAMNMRHPLTGGGMTVALNDVVILSDLLSPRNIPNLGDTKAVSRAMGELHWRRKQLTSIVNVLAQALYSLFSATDPNLAKLRHGCLDYFQKGIVDEPVAMLGGFLQKPTVLAFHFFSVAFLAIWLDAKKTGLWKLPIIMWNAIIILWTAVIVFVPVMYRELS
jgi:squalene monooxygenase